jgi:hypothetical protein
MLTIRRLMSEDPQLMPLHMLGIKAICESRHHAPNTPTTLSDFQVGAPGSKMRGRTCAMWVKALRFEANT